MSTEILDIMGLSDESYKSGEAGATIKEFEALPSGAYIGKVKHVIIYKNQWDGTQAQYIVSIEHNEETKDYKFRSDIGKTLKDGSDNKGYAGRLKQFSYATKTELADMTKGDDTEIKVFGKDCKGFFLKGMNDKKLKVLVRKTDDTNKAEGEPFKVTNDILGVVAMDGTDYEGEDAVKAFEEVVAKTPIFKNPKKVKGGSANPSTQATTKSGASVTDVL